MADDKTAAETYVEGQWAWGTQSVPWNDERNGHRILLRWQERNRNWRGVEIVNVWAESQIVDVRPVDRPADAVRRVAPDRDEVAEVIFDYNSKAIGSGVTFFYATTRMKKTAYEYADMLLASGVLGVPADQRTADRETIARALFGNRRTSKPERWEDLSKTQQRVWLGQAEGVAAVLVPADHVRAETLEALADEWGAFEPNWKHSQMDYWVRARAAEYRKEAGA